MSKSCAWFLALVVIAAPAWSANKKAELPGYVIPRSEVRTLPMNSAGRQYALFIGLPVSYATNPDKRYPVMYVTDGWGSRVCRRGSARSRRPAADRDNLT